MARVKIKWNWSGTLDANFLSTFPEAIAQIFHSTFESASTWMCYVLFTWAVLFHFLLLKIGDMLGIKVEDTKYSSFYQRQRLLFLKCKNNTR